MSPASFLALCSALAATTAPTTAGVNAPAQGAASAVAVEDQAGEDGRAADGPPPEAPALEVPAGETIVTAPRFPTPLHRTPAAVTVVDVADELVARPAAGLEQAFVHVPGVVARGATNAAQDLRLSIRGFGARAAFGIRGITVLVDGFPETLPDGQTQVDSIDLESMQQVEVLRGLASSLYGNAAGGVVRMQTLRPGAATSAGARVSAGEDGLAKLHVRGSGRAGALGYALTASALRSEGWRDHARAEHALGNALLTAPLADGELLVSLALVDAPVAEDPGGLTEAELRADRRRASPASLRFDAGESLRHARLGVSWTGRPAPGHAVEVAAWGARRSFRNAIPFTVVELDRDAGGAAARWSLRHGLGPTWGRLSVGGELHAQEDRRTNRPNEDGRPGDGLTLAQDEGVVAVGLFAQEEVALGRSATAVLGARWDATRFRVGDRLLSDGDASGERSFRQPTGRAGLIWSPSELASVYAAASQAYEVPTTTELVNLSRGGFDPDLRPQRAEGLEAGIRGGRWGAAWDVAAFAVRVRDGLVRQEDANGRAYYVNAARSTHAGLEAAASVALPAGLGARAAYTLLDARFDAYAPRGVELRGNRVPGLPRHAAAGELSWRHARGPEVAVELRSAGDWYADDENETRERLAWVAAARAAWPLRLAGATVVVPFLSVENAFSSRHADALRLNAAGGRYFEPAAPIQLRGGLSITYAPRPDPE